MTVHLFLAPAGAGKTNHVLEAILRVQSANPLTPIMPIFPNLTQVSAFQDRLGDAGGGLGVQFGTFYTLYPDTLALAGEPEPRLPEPLQYRLLQRAVTELTDNGRLSYYAPLRDKLGFATTLRSLIEELKRAGIGRDEF